MGEKNETFRMAQRTKRRIMMLPLLPEELITGEVVCLIIDDWKARSPEGLKGVFDDLTATFLATYVGTSPEDPHPVRPRFPLLSGVSVGGA